MNARPWFGCDCGGEHRTLGARAWCLDCREYCYPRPDGWCEVAVLRHEVEVLRLALAIAEDEQQR